ncbi:MAG: hypothetical protein AUH19_08795 [Verrucomicrobia bacterium 13_2_20CM_55_10]|nr:MAG: hypothetical protein AUH19_08795 [Verrucomicrobia bacterium 13_2_20CM_55_10]PYI63692.1 MAG: hypothetical protein DMF07_09560 [Verrucomicrobiota bacterium]
MIDSKRSRDQTLNFTNGFAGFYGGFVFVLIALYYPTKFIAVIRDRLSLRSKGETAGGTQAVHR